MHRFVRKILILCLSSIIQLLDPHSLEVGAWGECSESVLAALAAMTVYISLLQPWLAMPCIGMSMGADQNLGAVEKY